MDKSKTRLGLLTILSVILMLCMTLGLMSMTNTTAYAATTTRTTTLELSTFTGDESNAAEGWSWNHANRTLTLNSVNINVTSGYGISQKQNITDLTTVVLNGDNNITCNNEGLYCFGPLTIQGTGSLSITAADEKYYTAGIHSVGDLTIMSGTITATANSFLGSNYIYGIRAYNGDFIMYGGTVTATTGNAIGANQGTRGVSAINVKIYGGSLTTTAGTATGTETSVGVDASAGVTMTGGALIASGNTKAISSTITTTGTPTVKAGIDSSAGEITFASPGTLADKYVNISFATIFDNGFGKTDCTFASYTKGTKDDTIGYTFAGWFNGATELTDAANAVAGTTYTAKWTNNGKTVRFDALDLSDQESDLVNEDEGWAWYATASATYDENQPITATNHPAYTLILNGLTIDTTATDALVIDKNRAIIVLAEGSINVVSNKNAVGESIYGIRFKADDGFIKGTGKLTVTSGNATATANNKSASSYAISVYTCLYVYDGTVEAFAGNANSDRYSAYSTAISGGRYIYVRNNAKLTAIGGTAVGVDTVRGYGLSAGNGVNVDGGTTVVCSGQTKAIATLTFTATDANILTNTEATAGTGEYVEGSLSTYKWLSIYFAPTFDNGFGKTDCTFASYTKGTKDDTIGYTFAGWFNGESELETATNAVDGTTYTAIWMNNGKVVRFEALDLSAQSVDISNFDQGWAWDATTKTLTMTDATIDCSKLTASSYAIKLPDQSIIIANGVNTVRAGIITDIYIKSYAIDINGNATIKGDGILKVYGADIQREATRVSTLAIASTGTITVNGNVTFEVYSGSTTATSEIATSYALQATSLVIEDSANVTIKGENATSGLNLTTENAMSVGIKAAVTVNGGILNVIAETATIAEDAGLSLGIWGDLTVNSGSATIVGNSVAILGAVTTDGTIKAGADNSGTDTLYNGQKWLYVSFGPSITVGAQTGTLTYGAAASATYTVTASNFDAFNPTIEWITATHDGVTISVNGTTVTATITATANAGTYKFKVKSGETLSEEVTLIVGKATYGGQKTVNSTMPALGKVNATVWVPAASSGGAFGTPVASGTILCTNFSLGTNTLRFTAPASTAGQTGIITIPVTGCTNYEDYEIVVTLTSTNKTTVTIDGLSGENKDFTGSGISGVKGTATFTGGYTGELTYTYYSGSTATGTALTSAPTNAGTYTVRVAIPESDEEYTGYVDYTFTIAKAKLTVPTSKEVKETGSEQTVVLNGFDTATMTITGNVGTDVGEYTATVSIKDTANYEWADGSITAKTVFWTIIKTGLSGGAIAGIVIGSILILLAAAYACGYYFLYKKGKLDGKAIEVIYSFLKK